MSRPRPEEPTVNHNGPAASTPARSGPRDGAAAVAGPHRTAAEPPCTAPTVTPAARRRPR